MKSNDIDQRKYIRYELLDYAMVFTDGDTGGARSVVVDIGLGGLQVRSRVQFRVGASCMLKVGNFEDSPKVLRGEIRHSMPIPGSELFATGVRFLPETHEERTMVAEYVNSVFQRQADMLSG